MKNTSKIIAFDFQNTTSKSIKHWLKNQYHLDPVFAEEIVNKLIYDRKNKEEFSEIIYVINNFWLAESTNIGYPEIRFSESYSKDFINLQPIKLQEIEVYRSVLIEWMYNLNKKNFEIFNAVLPLKRIVDSDNTSQDNVFEDVVCIDVLGLGIKLRDLFMPLQKKFKAIHQFFAATYEKKHLLEKVSVSKIYLLDGFILGYNLVLDNELEEHYFENFYIEEQLQLMEKIRIA